MSHTQTFDENDPHHESHHHGHVILRTSTLVGVLLALLFLTGITVGAAQLESWVAETWHIHIPSLFNACVAMSIAIVKAVLVFMFFMQLKYDNPLNSILMGFTFFAVGLFLFFSMIDLGNRAVIYPYKDGEIQRGGQGISTVVELTGADGKPLLDAQGKPRTAGVNTQNKPIVVWARESFLEKLREDAATGKLTPPLAPGETPEQRFEKLKAEAHAHARGGHHGEAHEQASADRAMPPKSLGPAMYLDQKPAAPAHGSGH